MLDENVITLFTGRQTLHWIKIKAHKGGKKKRDDHTKCIRDTTNKSQIWTKFRKLYSYYSNSSKHYCILCHATITAIFKHFQNSANHLFPIQETGLWNLYLGTNSCFQPPKPSCHLCLWTQYSTLELLKIIKFTDIINEICYIPKGYKHTDQK